MTSLKNQQSRVLKLLSLALWMFQTTVWAQQDAWTLFSSDPAVINQLLPAIKKDQAVFLSYYPKADQEYASAFYTERGEAIDAVIKQHAIISDPVLNAYLGKLTSILLQKQPAIRSKNLRLHFSRDFVPNACSYGEGTILFNIGLFARLNNEAEAAFVLAHEIGHYMLGHADQRIRKYISQIYNDSMQQVLRKLQKKEYGKSAILDTLLKQQAFSFSRHSRENEMQADSFALAILMQTPFAPAAARSCLSLLDTVDADHYRDPLDVQQIFNYPEYPFKARWLRKEQNIFANDPDHADKLEDSLKTHPDCHQRIMALNPRLANAESSAVFLVDSVYFRAVQKTMKMEMAAYAYTSGNVSRALFYALNLQQVTPAEIFPVKLAGQCLNDLYDAMKRHELRKICALPGLRVEGAYDEFVHFLENLRLNDIGALTYYFHLQHNTLASSDQQFAVSKKKSAEILTQQIKP